MSWTPPYILAPMEGVTHAYTRQEFAERGGLGMVCTEFVRITDTNATQKHLKLDLTEPLGIPLSVQVMGRQEQHMAQAARILVDHGAKIIDINMGCPSRCAKKAGVGSAMLKDQALMKRVVKAMREAVHGTLSVKIRAGYDDVHHFLEILNILEGEGVDYIAIHPRTQKDQYRGVADWRMIAAAKDHLNIPVIGNGDCWSAHCALRMLKETGCDAVMLGRSALRNPWIFEQIQALEAGTIPRSPSAQDINNVVCAWVTMYQENFPEKAAIGYLKERIRFLARAFDDEREFRNACLRSRTLDEVQESAGRVLEHCNIQKIDLGPEMKLNLERSGSIYQDREVAA